MALIECPECKKEISDKATACPHCGNPFGSFDNLTVNDVSPHTAPQLVEVTGVRISKKSKKYIIVSLVLLLIAVAAVFAVRFINAQSAQKNYVENLQMFRVLSLPSMSVAESVCNLTGQVWRNTISENKDSKTDKYTRPNGYFVNDFNKAIANFYSDPETKSNITSIESSKDTIKGKWKELQSPPEGLEKCYDIANQLYEAYNGLTGLAINPSGNLSSFLAKKQEYVDNYLKYYEQLGDNIPEKFFE